MHKTNLKKFAIMTKVFKIDCRYCASMILLLMTLETLPKTIPRFKCSEGGTLETINQKRKKEV